MMKKLIPGLILALLPFLSDAQDDFTGEVRWGSPIVLKKKESGPDAIGVSDGVLYATKMKNAYSKKRVTFLQMYDLKSLTLQSEMQMNLDYQGNKLLLINHFIFDEKVVFISYYVTEDGDKKVYLLHEMNGGEVAKPVVLAEVSDSKAKKRMVLMNSYLRMSSFRHTDLEDKQSLMIMYRDEITSEDKDPNLNTVVYNKELQEVSRGVLDLENYITTSTRLLNDGRLLMLGFEAIEGQTKGLIKRETIERGDCCMLFYDGNSIEKTKIDISKTVNSLSSKILPDNSLVVYGLYSNESVKGVSGTFFIQWMKTEQSENGHTGFRREFHHAVLDRKTEEESRKAPGKKGKKIPSLPFTVM